MLNFNIPMHRPHLTGMDSCLELTSSVSIFPVLGYDKYISYRFNVSTPTLNDKFVKISTTLIASYKLSNKSIYSEGVVKPTPFFLDSLGACVEPRIAFSLGEPCFYLKINKIYGWLPDLETPDIFPNITISCGGLIKSKSLRRGLIAFQGTLSLVINVAGNGTLDHIHNATDKLLLGRPVYHPEFIDTNGTFYGSISPVFYPYLNQPGYQRPLLAVQFPAIKRNTLVRVKCQTHGLKNAKGDVEFDLSVGDMANTEPLPTPVP